MKFVISSQDLLNHLQGISKVISSKNTLPILDNFLFNLSETELVVTASDLETTLVTRIEMSNVDGSGSVALPAKILIDTLSTFPEQPLTFDIDLDELKADIYSENGKYSIPGAMADDYPMYPELKAEEKNTSSIPAEALLTGINSTLFATGDDELRPVMNGIFMEFSTEKLTFVASDAHKLVRYRRTDIVSDKDSSFILPKKPAAILKTLVGKKDVVNVNVEFDDKNAVFTMNSYTLICRQVEGKYPNYESVIPSDNPNVMTIDRVNFSQTLKRISVFSSQASNLVRFKLENNQITVSGQDIDFSISAFEKLNCQYDGEDLEIGFKSSFLAEIINNLQSPDVKVEMSDPGRAAIILPSEKSNESEDTLMLLMPMMIN